MFVVVLFILSMVPAVLRSRVVPVELWALLVFDFIAIGGSTLVVAQSRQFTPVVPALCVWSAFIYVRVLRIELRSENKVCSANESVFVGS